MAIKVKQTEQRLEVKRYKVQYPISTYTFPREARIHRLWWIPTVYNAEPAEREKYEINRNRTAIIWDPAKCAINDELYIADYLESGNDDR